MPTTFLPPNPHPEAQTLLNTALPANTSPITAITTLPSSLNSTFKLTLLSGTIYILKLAPPSTTRLLRHESNLLATESHLLSHLSASTSLPTPKLITYDASCSLLDAPYLLMSYLPGTPLPSLRSTLPPPILAQKVAAVKERLASTPQQAPGSFGLAAPDSARYSSWRECFVALLEGVLRDGEEMQVLLPYEGLRGAVARVGWALEEVVVPRLVLADWGDGSVLVEGEEVTGVVDFERGLWGDVQFGGVGGFDDVLGRLTEGGKGKGREGERYRGLLYSSYHSTVKIIESYYHPSESNNEMAERKNLIKCLNALGPTT